ncbi:Shieldin complex subunit 2 [Actinomortierella ambigua]|uniref:Shieldin complex subunit 2 n=1 Tax=Actinomortierella ambigua TaxID=1343610 RepID=A0A9P6U6H4_9FUNG|nr:Shieldin complex subunit 2 [Actinomortierella ambigua]
MPRGRSASNGVRGAGRKPRSSLSSTSARPKAAVPDLPSDPEFAAFRPTSNTSSPQHVSSGTSSRRTSSSRTSQPNHSRSSGTHNSLNNIVNSNSGNSSSSSSRSNKSSSSRLDSSSGGNNMSCTSKEFEDRVPCTLDMLSMVPATLPENLEKGEREADQQHESDMHIGGNTSLSFSENAAAAAGTTSSSTSRKHTLLTIDDDVDPIGSFTEFDPGVDLMSDTGITTTPTSSQTLLRTPSKRFVIPPDALHSPSSSRHHQREMSTTLTTSTTAGTPNKRMRSVSDISKRLTLPTGPTRSPTKQPFAPNTPSSRLRPVSAIGFALQAAISPSRSSSPARASVTLAGHSRDQSVLAPPPPILANLLAIARDAKAGHVEEQAEEEGGSPPPHQHSLTMDDSDHEPTTRSMESTRLPTTPRPQRHTQFLAFRDQERLAEPDLSQSSMASVVLAAELPPQSPLSSTYITQDFMSNHPIAEDGEGDSTEAKPRTRRSSPRDRVGTRSNDKELDQVSQRWRLCSFDSLPPTQIMSHEVQGEDEGSLPPTQLMAHELPTLAPTQTIIKQEDTCEELKEVDQRRPDNETSLELSPLLPSPPPAQQGVQGRLELDRFNDVKVESASQDASLLKSLAHPTATQPQHLPPLPPPLPPQPLLPSTDFLDRLTLSLPAAVLKYADRLTPLARCLDSQVSTLSKYQRWHLLVLVIHVDPVEQIETRKGPQAGQRIAKASITVSDGSASGFKIVLWREKTLWLEEIQEGDVALLSAVLESYTGHKEIEEKLHVLATKRRQLGLQVLHDIREPSFYASMMPCSPIATFGNNCRHHDGGEPAEEDHGHAREEHRSVASHAPPIGDAPLIPHSPKVGEKMQRTFSPGRPSARKPSAAASSSSTIQPQHATAQANKTFLQVHSRAAVSRPNQSLSSSSSSSSLAAGSKVRGRVVYTMLQKPNRPASGWYIGIVVVKEGRMLRVETWSTAFPSIQALHAARFSGNAILDVYLHAIEFSCQPTPSSWLDGNSENGEGEEDEFIQCICVQCQTPADRDPANPTLFFCRRCRDMEAATAHRRFGGGDSGSKNSSFTGIDSSLQWSYAPFHVVVSDQPPRLRETFKKRQKQEKQQQRSGSGDPSSTETNTLRVFCSYGRGDELFVSIPARRWIHERQQRQLQRQQRPRPSETMYDRWKRLVRLLTAPPPPPPPPSSPLHRERGNETNHKIRFHVRVLSTFSHAAPSAPSLSSMDAPFNQAPFGNTGMTTAAKAIQIQLFFT